MALFLDLEFEMEKGKKPRIERKLAKKYPLFKNKWFAHFIKAALFSGAGYLAHLLILFIFTEFLGIYYLISAIVGFVMGSSINYVINKRYTFDEEIKYHFVKKYFKYILVSLISLGASLALLYIFTEFLSIYYLLSQVFATAIVFLVKFVIIKICIFKD